MWIRIVVLTGLPVHRPAKTGADAAVRQEPWHGPNRFTRGKPVDSARLAQTGDDNLLQSGGSLVSLHFPHQEERIMAKGAMKAGKEARKPKKDAKKPAATPALKAPPVKAMKLKDK
jgi:hypothetical protein